jgi:DNA mismatch repair protein MutS2
LDELGAGTDPTEGSSLAMAILEKLHLNNAKVIATTHYGQLKSYAYNTPGVQNASVEFDINTLKPTYRLIMGMPGKSNAFEISLRLGLSEEIIERAKKFIDTNELKADELIKKLEENQLESEKEKNAAIISRKESENIRNELYQKNIDLNNKKNEIISNAAKEAREIIKKAQEESKRILQKLEHNKEIQEFQQKLKKMDEDLKAKSKKNIIYHGEIPKNVKKGDMVNVPKLKGKGQVISEVSSEGEVLIQIGIMKINVNIKDLRFIRDDNKKEEKKTISRIITQKNKKISSEIDLRGMTVEEAVDKMDKYLDDAYLAGLNQASIIHGKGTGALRKGIRNYLENRVHIKSLRFGEPSEGGTGVTIVEFK